MRGWDVLNLRFLNISWVNPDSQKPSIGDDAKSPYVGGPMETHLKLECLRWDFCGSMPGQILQSNLQVKFWQRNEAGLRF